MRILHVITRMNVGGTARYLENLLPQLNENGHTVLLAVGNIEGEEVEDPCLSQLPHIRINNLYRSINFLRDIKSHRELSKIIREFRPDIIHSHTFKAGLISRTQVRRSIVVHTFHGHLFDDPNFSKFQIKLIVAIERVLALRTQTLITVGKKVSLELMEKGIGRESKFCSIPPGVKPLVRMNREIASASLGLDPKSKFRVGWLARMAPVKRPSLYVDIAHSMPNIEFIMGGGGEMLDNVRSQAPENLKVLGWVEASKFLSAVDLVVSTSANEGMPVALIEAQMLGLPVIATDVGSVREVIRDANTGKLCESKEVFVATIQSLSDNEGLLRKMSKTSASRALDEFSIFRMVSSHIKIYSHLDSRIAR